MIPNSSNQTKPHDEASQRWGRPEVNDPSETSELFDDRPQDSIHEKTVADWLREKVSLFSAHCREASEWIQQKWAVLTKSSDIELNIKNISKPRNFKKKSLPENLEKQLQSMAVEKKKAAAKENFIQGIDAPNQTDLLKRNADEIAFDSYAKLCKQAGDSTGATACPQNFNDASVRHAKEFLGHVEQRKLISENSESEFWLSSADQEKLELAKGLLAQQVDKDSKKIVESVGKLGPIQTNSSTQYLSFMAWREWRLNVAEQPNCEEFSIDAAVAYANEQLKKYASTSLAADEQVKALLNDAAELISRKEFYADIYNDLISVFESAANLKGSKPNVESVDAKVPASSESSESLASPASPPLPPPSRTKNNAILANVVNIPDLSTLDPDIQSLGYTRLNQFFSYYIDLNDKSAAKIDTHDPLFVAIVSAAAKFLETSSASPEGVDGQMFAAANFLIKAYGQH